MMLGTRRGLLQSRPMTWNDLLGLPGMAIALRADRGVYTDGAALFTAANKEFLYRTDPADLDFGTGDFSLSFHFYRTTTGEQAIGGKYQDVNNNWLIDFDASGRLLFNCVQSGGTRALVRGTTNLSTTGAWYHAVILVDRDSSAGCQVWINGADNTGGTPVVSASDADNTGDFHLGDDGNGAQSFDGRLDSFLVTKRLLTSTEIAALYNGGKGVSWDEIEAGAGGLAAINDASLVAFYELDEADGVDRADSKGANDLTPSGVNLVTNGTFDADTDWTKVVPEWSISAGGAQAGVATGDLEQTLTGDVQSGKKYYTSYDVTLANAGDVVIKIGGTSGTTRSTVATFTETILGGATNELIEFTAAAFDGTLDNVSVISLGPSWAVGVQSTGQVNDDDDVVGTWESQKGGHLFQQTTLTKRPTWKPNIFGTKPGVLFDGTDDLLVKASAFLTGTKGYVIALVKLSASPSDFQGVLSSADEGSADYYFEAEAYNASGTPNVAYYQDSLDAADTVRGSTTISAATNYIIVLQSNGEAGGLTFRVNRANETETRLAGANPYNGDWWGDTAERDNTVIGALKRSTEADFLKGYLGVLLAGDNAVLTERQMQAVERWMNSWAGGGIV